MENLHTGRYKGHPVKYILITLISLFFTNFAFSKSENTLFTFNPQTKSSHEANFPIAQSLAEWDIKFNQTLVSADNDSFDLVLPNVDIKNNRLSVVRTSYRLYESGSAQWVGDIISSDGNSGYIIVNIINSKTFGTILVNGSKYEIYTDRIVGTRLAKLGLIGNVNDVATSNNSYYLNRTKTKLNSFSQPNGTSVVDVLVLIDNDLIDSSNPADSPIYDIIESEAMNANLILSQSGVNGDENGIPLRLNFLTPQTINIPTNLQEINYPYHAFNNFVGGVSKTSNQIIKRYNSSNADIVALYIPFDPLPFAVGGPFGACGVAGWPVEKSEDTIFAKSFSLLSNSCGQSSFTLLHEILHNFGSHHNRAEAIYDSSTNTNDEDRGIETYANGILKVNSSKEEITTVMDCIQAQFGDDPSTLSCNRIPQLSSPSVNIDGAVIGDQAIADNVRFLSECTKTSCRREELANRVSGSHPVDLIPAVNILTPADGQSIPPTNSFTLTANATDDNAVESVTWNISKNNQIVLSEALGTGPNHSFVTNAFSSLGEYVVSATVIDNIGLIKIDTHVVTVSPTPDEYDNLTIRGYTDDYEGDAVSLLQNQPQNHNFHDAGDEDWTMIWSSVPKAMNFSTQMIGANSDTTAEVYKVTDIIVNPNYPGQNRFIINNMQLIGSDSSVGNSSVDFNTEAGFLYVMKVQSRTNSFGDGTDYTVLQYGIPITEDEYDNVSLRGFTDDYEGDAVSLPAGQSQIHNFHDNGDKDWVMTWSGAVHTLKYSAEMIGANSDAKVSVYKVTDVIENPNHVGQNRFIINQLELVGSSTSVGNSSVTYTTEAGFLYVIKTESRTNSYGAGTEYRAKLNFVNN